MITIRSDADLARVPEPVRASVAAALHSVQRQFAELGEQWDADRDGPLYWSDGDGAADFDAIGLTWPPDEWTPEAVERRDGALYAVFTYNNDFAIGVFFGLGTLPEVRAALERDHDR